MNLLTGLLSLGPELLIGLRVMSFTEMGNIAERRKLKEIQI